MPSVEFFINLHRPDAVFFAGEKISGWLLLRAAHLIEVAAVRVSAEGYGHAQWMDTEGGGRRMRRRLFTKSETYYKSSQLLASAERTFFLEPGEYTLPFEIELPVNVPSSFEHELARVRHFLLASVEMPIDNDVHIYQAISVVDRLDLNETPALRLPTNASESSSGVCCLRPQPVTATVILHRGGVVPGHALVCDVTVDNRTTRELPAPRVRLVERLEFRALGKTRHLKREVCALELSRPVPAGATERYEGVEMRVPAVAPTARSMDNVVESEYAFELTFRTGGLPASKTISIPIVVGSRPFVDAVASSDSSQATLVLDAVEDYQIQACHFDVLAQDSMPSDHPARGSVVQSNARSYFPRYPVYGTSK